jgi:hypothetical protein
MNTKKQEKIITDWEKMQKRGLLKHILLIGGIFALITNFFSLDLDKLYLFKNLMFSLKFVGKLVFLAVAFGLLTWFAQRWQYNKTMSEKDNIENL